MVSRDYASVTVDREGWYEVEVVVDSAVVGMCSMDDPNWPCIEATLSLSPSQARTLLRELAHEVTLEDEARDVRHVEKKP